MSKITTKLICCLFVFMAGLMSCEKQEVGLTKTSEQISIEEAQNWFDENVSNGYLASQKNENTRKKETNWQKATSKLIGTTPTVMVPLKYEAGYGVGNRGYTFLLVYKTPKGAYTAEILKIIASEEHLLKNKGQLNSATFTGTIKIYDWNDNFLKGDLFRDGKAVGSLSKTVGQTGGKMMRINDESCRLYMVTETFYQRGCYDTGQGQYECGEWELRWIDVTYVLECTGGAGGNNGFQPSNYGLPNNDLGCGPGQPVSLECIDYTQGTMATVEIEEISDNELCGSYNFAKTGNGLTAEIIGLGASGVQRSSGQFVSALWGSMCITFYDNGLVHTSNNASIAFNEAWNESMIETEAWLNRTPNPTDYQFAQVILSALMVNLARTSGATFSYNLATGPCQNVPSSVASYCP
ncbi:MAG: hypothetical protein H7Y04_01245 [Verrucomicrobia bacterium]|nr:hypothetical protein [Cytophagales bacterium]